MDNLSYSYSGNQLQSVTDASTDANTNGYKSGTSNYAYDDNGNVNQDESRGVGSNGISYNMLNLPQSIPSKGMSYTYDATGRKLRKVFNSTTTEYV